jgi:GLPGLI family protein
MIKEVRQIKKPAIMKYFFLVLLTLITIPSISQKSSPTYIVKYNCSEKYAGDDLHFDTKKTEVKITQITGGDTISVSKDSMPTASLLTSLSIEMELTIKASPVSAITLYNSSQDKSSNVQMTINTPDTIFNTADSWEKVKDGKREKMETYSLPFVKTAETKKIVGITCTKYKTSDNSPRNIWIWVSTALPGTIVPFAGLISVPGAILEIQEFGKSPSIATAISLKKETTDSF